MKRIFYMVTGFIRAHIAASAAVGGAVLILGAGTAGVLVSKNLKNKFKKTDAPVKEVSSVVSSSSESSSSEEPAEPVQEIAKEAPGAVLKSTKYKYSPKEDPLKSNNTALKSEPAPEPVEFKVTKVIDSGPKYETKEIDAVTVKEECPVFSEIDRPELIAFSALPEKEYEILEKAEIKVMSLQGDGEDLSEEENPEEIKKFYKIKYDPEFDDDNKDENAKAVEGWLDKEFVKEEKKVARKTVIKTRLPDGRLFSDGFNTVDGKTYFVSEGKILTGYVEINGMRYHFDEITGVKDCEVGIDVSVYQGKIDWAKVKAAGIDFAIIRLGFRGYETGSIKLDANFETNLRNAQKNGIKCGVYFYSVALNEAEAAEEARFVLNALAGKRLDLPAYIDIEHKDNRVKDLSKAQRTANAISFMNTISSGGFTPGIYTYINYYDNYLESEKIKNNNLWIAYYTENVRTKRFDGVPYVMWQYTSSGSVPGINGRVDLNIKNKK